MTKLLTKISLKMKPVQYGPLIDEFPMHPPSPSSKIYNKMSTCEKGDEMVTWVDDLLSSDDFKNIVSEHVNISGISNNIFDIIVRINGDKDKSIRGIQVKTLYFNHTSTDSWRAKLRCDYTYPPDTLMILINPDKTRFVLAYWKDISGKSDNFNFTINVNAPGSIKFTNFQLFTTQLGTMVKEATIIKDIADGVTNKQTLKEYNSLRIIKNECEKRGIKFEYHWTVNSAIDIYLNGHRCQCKTSGCIPSYLYAVKSSKTESCIELPYSIDDNIEYFIVQVGTELTPNPYCNDICFIPIRVLINKNTISSKDNAGNSNFLLAPPNHFEYHWSDSMWNNYELIQKGLQLIEDPIYKFINQYNCSIIDTGCKRGKKYKATISMNDPNINFFIFFINDGNTVLYKDYVMIITRQELVKENKSHDSTLRSKTLCIAPPDYICTPRRADWSLKYWKKIEDLDSFIMCIDSCK
jgi:hypothetical protein